MLCECTLLRVQLARLCVVCYVMRDCLWVMWKDSCCICEFIEGVGAIDLLFCDQYFMLVEYLHVKGLPTVHMCAFTACL